MKKHLFGLSILIYILGSVSNFSLAQSVCAVSLSDAQDNYESGHLYGIPALLKPCLDNGFSKAEKIQAYWLLTSTYLIIDDPISAEDSYLKLLNLDPEYKIDEQSGSVEIVHLSKKFKTTPIFTWTYGKVGLNVTSVSIINTYSTGNNNSLIVYSDALGFQFSSSLELNINERWSINGEAMFARRSFTLKNTLFTDDKQKLTENQLWIELPFYVKYSRRFDRFHPYIYGGYSLQYLLESKVNAELINNEPTGQQQTKVLGESLTKSRNRFTQSALAGVGVRYRIGYYYLMFEARYTIGMKNLLSEQNQYTKSGDSYNNQLQFLYSYVDSDFRINSLSATFGVVLPLYKPRRIAARPHLIQRLFTKKREVKE